MPDLRGRVLQEQDTAHTVGQLIDAGLPNITGGVRWMFMGYTHGNADHSSGNRNYGAMHFGNTLEQSMWGQGTVGETAGTNIPHNWAKGIFIDASKSNSIYGKSSTVQPHAYAIRHLIRARP